MKIKLLDYSGPLSEHDFNIGDDIQTIAMQGLVETFDGYISREHLNIDIEDKTVVPMNGFFLQEKTGHLLKILSRYYIHFTSGINQKH